MLLSELLEAVPEAGLVLLTPDVCLERPVSGIDSSETPDIAQYTAPDTLLLTTAMMFRSDPEGLARMIEQLHEVKTAGIAIKTGRFIAEVAPSVLEVAQHLGYPVFQIPFDTTLGVTYHKLQSHIWGIETRQTYLALEIQKTMSRMLFGEASLLQLLQYFAHKIGHDVLFFDYFFDLHAAGTENGVGQPDEQRTVEIGSLLKQAHAVKPITLMDELHLTTSWGGLTCIVTPIEAGNSYPHYLVILSEEDIPQPLLYTVAELVSMVLSFLVHNRLRLIESEWRSKAEHFQRLLHIKSQSESSFIDAYQLAFTFPLPELGQYQIVAIGFDASALPPESKKMDHFALVQLWVEKQTAALKERCALIPLRESGHLLLFIREPQGVLPLMLQAMAEQLLEYVPLALRFGIGNQTHKLESLSASYLEAVAALQRALGNLELPVVQFYSSEGIHELIQFAPDDHIRHYCSHILQSLAYPEGEYYCSLRDTLEVYLNCQCDITHTAKLLFVHRNTIRYRLTKIQNLLLHDLDDPEFTLQVRLAIYLSATRGS
ncbi:MAG: helix-turn-helix domain-containing protein [Coriobacteriia bacterium]|nr:helix-turn-helix domain-containing protein [Coriobacteriia bacterium]